MTAPLNQHLPDPALTAADGAVEAGLKAGAEPTAVTEPHLTRRALASLRHDPVALISLLVVVGLAVMAVFAPSSPPTTRCTPSPTGWPLTARLSIPAARSCSAPTPRAATCCPG